MNNFFVCPYCHYVVGTTDDNGYICEVCNISYGYNHDVYYFYDENAEHWKRTLREVKLQFDIALKAKHYSAWGNYFPFGGYPYINLENCQDNLSQRVNASLFNVAFEFLHKILIKGSGFLVEIGAGNGWASYLLSRYIRVFAVDVMDLPGLGVGGIMPDFGRGIIRIVADGQYLPFPDCSIDAIYMNSAYHHMYDKEKALSEWWRILKSGGMVVATGETSVETKEQIHQTDIGEHGYTREEMRKTFEQSKFAIARFPTIYCENMEYMNSFQLTGHDAINGVILGVKT